MNGGPETASWKFQKRGGRLAQKRKTVFTVDAPNVENAWGNVTKIILFHIGIDSGNEGGSFHAKTSRARCDHLTDFYNFLWVGSL